MIEISPETACMFYVGGFMILLFWTWLRHSHKAKKREVIKLTSAHVTCEFCSHNYLAETFTSYHRCPKCHCMNTQPTANKKK